MKKKLFSFLPLFFLLFLWIGIGKPYFFDHLVPYPSRQLVANFLPWEAYPENAGPIKNNAMPDIITQIYPWKHFTIDQLKKGQLPLWNPYAFSGNPHLANYQTGVFSPFNLLYLILPFLDSWSIVILLQPLIAGLGMYLLLRQYRVSAIGSSLSGIAFMFCGFMIVWMEYGTLSMAIAFLPWALYAIERYWQEESLSSLLIFIVSIILSLFSGHFQTSLYLLLAVVAYIVFKVWQSRDLKKIRGLGIAFFVSLCIASVQLIPTILFYTQSFRSSSLIVDKGIPLYYLVTLFAPDFFGNPVTRNDWVGFYAERASFVGVIPLVLAAFSFFSKKLQLVSFYVALGLVSLLLALDSPLQILLRISHLPVISTSNPTRIIVLVSFALATLAGFGLDALLTLLQAKKKKAIGGILLLFMLLFAFVWITVVLMHIFPPDKLSTALHNLLLPTALFLILTVLLVVGLFLPKKKLLLAISIILICLMGMDSFRFAYKWLPFDRRDLVYPDVSVIAAMQQLRGTGRVYGAFGQEVQVYYGIPSIEGYDPLYSQRYGEFIKSLTTGQLTTPDRSFVSLDRQSPMLDRVFDLLGVSLVFQPRSYAHQPWAYPVWAKTNRYKKVYGDDKFQLFTNKDALPRAMLFYNYAVIPDAKKEIATFYRATFPFRTTLLLEEYPDLAANTSEGSGSAKIISLDPTAVTIQTQSTKPALLFLSDIYYPTWKATVNGKKVKILRADYAFRAVEVPAGKATVKFSDSFLL